MNDQCSNKSLWATSNRHSELTKCAMSHFPGRAAGVGGFLQKSPPVAVVREDGAALVAAGHDVIGCPGIRRAEVPAWRPMRMAPACAQVKPLIPTSEDPNGTYELIAGALRLRSEAARKFVHCDARRANQAAQSPFGDFFVVGNGERRNFTLSNHDDVTAALAGDLPAKPFKGPCGLAPA